MLKRSLARWVRSREARSVVAPSTADAAVRGDPDGWFLQGTQHAAAGRLAEAQRALAQAIDLQHDHAEALLLQGMIHLRQGYLEEATDHLLLAEHFQPGLAEVKFQLGLIANSKRRRAEAERCFREAIKCDPHHAKAHNALGATLVEASSFDAAADCFRAAIALKPGLAQAHSNLGCLLVTRLDRFDEGAAHIETAWRLAPDERDIIVNWAMLLQHRGRLAEALALCERLIELGANVQDARLNRALILLKQGDFARGWSDYEARKQTLSEYVPREFPFPAWDGAPLAGRTILVHNEQGLGDQIMFASCIPDLVPLAGHCVVECAGKLEPLFRRSFPAVTTVSADEIAASGEWLKRVPPIDYHVAVGSLPLRFRNSLAEFPDHDGYLRADAVKAEAWKRRLAELPGRRKIGISWLGGRKQTRQSGRSVSLDQWLPILRCEEITFVSLQYTECGADLSDLERKWGVRVHHWQEAIDDYDETAALVTALDLVISVQTAIVHLSGALGRPAWVMVSAVAEWRYLESGEHMPWYPSVRIWRQGEPGAWRPVIERVAGELARTGHAK